MFSIATVSQQGPWCASCFYVWDEDHNSFIITTDLTTRHGKEFLGNPSVAGTIALETRRVGRICGAQFTGEVTVLEGDALRRARRLFLKRFPYAALFTLHLWEVRLSHIKLTDNRLGFGKKIVWDREEETSSSSPE